MAAFLQIVGAVFVALILVAIGLLLFLRWKLKSWAKQVSEQVQEFGGLMEKMAAHGGPMAAALGGMAEPLTLTLKPTSEEPDEDFALQIKAWTKGLIGIGFETVNDFDAEPTMLWMRGLTHPETGAAAVIYVMPLAGCWFEVCARTEEQDRITVGNSPQPMADVPPWCDTHRIDEGVPPAKAYEKLLRKVGERPISPYTPDNFANSFEQAYRRDMLWRVKRGDSEEETRRIVAAGDDGEAPDNSMIDRLMESRRQMRSMQIDEMLKEQWLKESNVSAFDYERIEDRLVVVHELTPPDQLLDIWGDAYGDAFDDDPPELPDVSQLISNQEPRKAFQTLQQNLPPESRFVHHASIEGDIAGDLWLRPKG